MDAKVSVIIPVYGVEPYIERCARSLFEQTLEEIEYLFVDDCSPDKSIEVLKRVLEDYPMRKSQVIIHRMMQNSGQAKVREWGMRNATSEYFIHCDSDDWIDKDMYRLMYEKAIQENTDIIICDYAIANNKQVIRKVSGCSNIDKESFINDLLMEKHSWSLCNKLFKRSTCIKDGMTFPQESMGEDMATVFQCLLNGRGISYIHQPLYFYFFNSDSISHGATIEKRMRNFYQNKENTDIVLAVFNRFGISEKYSKGIFNLKWRAKKFLWDMPYEKQRRELWINTYKEINKSLLFSSNISMKDKMKVFLVFCGCYPQKYSMN